MTRRANTSALLNAHAFLTVERPPDVWDADVEDVPLVRLLGEMIAAALARGTPLERVVLRAANVVVEASEAGGAGELGGAPAPGEYLALSVMGRGDWGPETAWRPGDADAPTLVNRDLDAAARAATVPYAYTGPGDDGSVTVYLPRHRP